MFWKGSNDFVHDAIPVGIGAVVQVFWLGQE